MATSTGRSIAGRHETSLYGAVKQHLEQLGFEAKGEICGYDIVAVRAAAQPFLVIVEMKLQQARPALPLLCRPAGAEGRGLCA